MLNRCLDRNFALWTTLALWVGLDASGAYAECRFRNTASEDVLTYRFSSDESPSGRRLVIKMAFLTEAGVPTKIEIPSDLISDLSIEGSTVTLKRDPKFREVTVSAAKSALATLTYTLRNGWSGPLVHPHEFQPVILPAYAEITGDKALIWRKRDQDAQVTVNFDWQGIPPAWALATSFGVAGPTSANVPGEVTSSANDRCQTYSGPWVGANQALFAAGDFRLHPFQIGHKPGMLAVRGTWTFSDDEAAQEIGKTIQLVRDFWHDDAFPRFLVTLQPFDQDHGSSDGTAYTDAFWMYVSRKDNINGLISQLAHESFHAWNPLKMGYLSTAEFEKIKWFKEGFTEYYAQKLTLAGGEQSIEQVVASTNRDLLAFPSSTSEYVRGRVIALWLDAAIRKQSNGQHSLDDVMFHLVKDRQQPLTEERIYDAVQPYISAAQFSSLKNAADGGGDLPAPDTIPGLGICYHAIHGDFPTFDLGLDFSASRAARAVSKIDPSGPAYRAGLRDGQPIVAWDIDRGNTERQATVTVRVEGRTERSPSTHSVNRQPHGSTDQGQMPASRRVNPLRTWDIREPLASVSGLKESTKFDVAVRFHIICGSSDSATIVIRQHNDGYFLQIRSKDPLARNTEIVAVNQAEDLTHASAARQRVEPIGIRCVLCHVPVPVRCSDRPPRHPTLP